MFQLSGLQLLGFEHSHGDNDWHRMHEVTAAHDSAASDPERQWDRGHRIFRCDSCSEEIRVSTPDSEQPR